MVHAMTNAICLFKRFRIHHMQHDNHIHLEVHKPAFSYRPTSDHQVVPEYEKAVIQSARQDVAI